MTHAYAGEPERGRRIPINSTTSRTAREPGPNKTGGRLVAGASVLAGLLLVVGVVVLVALPRQNGTPPAQAAPPAPKLSPSAARYLAIANPANHSLEVSNDAYKKDELSNLAAAKSDLRGEVATETKFDTQLAQIPFPLGDASIVRALIAANQQRGALTARQARSTSLAQLRSLDARHQATDAAVEAQVRLLRKALGLPPPSTS
jgi:hypothetical protein